MCDRTIAAGIFSCERDYCLTCAQSHSCDHACSLPCGNTESDDGGGHRRNRRRRRLKEKRDAKTRRQTQTMNVTEAHGDIFNWNLVNRMACPLDAVINRAEEVEDWCCSDGECERGLPSSCTFDCGRHFTSFVLDCNQTIQTIFSEATVSEYVAFDDECSRMEPLSMVRSVDESFCANCGNNVTETPFEQCDDGPANSYAPNACRPGCQLPSCGDGVHDTETEGCDDGDLNAPDGACGFDCQPTSPCAQAILANDPECCETFCAHQRGLWGTDGSQRSGRNCQGDCDHDSDCQGSLRCKQRDRDETVRLMYVLTFYQQGLFESYCHLTFTFVRSRAAGRVRVRARRDRAKRATIHGTTAVRIHALCRWCWLLILSLANGLWVCRQSKR